MFEALNELLAGDTVATVERFDLPGHPAGHSPVPRFLRNSRVGWHLNRRFKASNGRLYLALHEGGEPVPQEFHRLTDALVVGGGH